LCIENIEQTIQIKGYMKNILGLLLGLLSITTSFASVNSKEYLIRDGLAIYDESVKGANVIHFLNTRSQDAILLESNGRFALIDSGEPFFAQNGRERDGYADYIIEYILRATGGIGHLEFVVGTHPHIDHMGGFKTILSHPRITADRAYFQPYMNNGYTKEMMEVCEARNIKMIYENLNLLPITLGNMNLKIINGKFIPEQSVNDASLGQLVEVNGLRAYLAGDITGYQNERSLLPDIGGKIDLLKIGHHGYDGANGSEYLEALKPDVAIYTNIYKWINENVVRRVANSGAVQYATGDFGGIVAVFDSTIKYYAIGDYPLDKYTMENYREVE